MINEPIDNEPREVWCCPDCGDAHPDIDEAIDCCALPPPLESWQCRQCDAVHAEREDARLCCFDADGEPLPPSAAELEAHGQMRLSAYGNTHRAGIRRGVLIEALDRLPSLSRTVLGLYFVEQLNVAEIGAVLEIPEAKAQTILSLAIVGLEAAGQPHLEIRP